MTDYQRDAALSQLRHLELAALIEAAMLAALVFVAVPLKHLAEWDLAVRLLGPVHGCAFLAYLWNVWQSGTTIPWRGTELTRLIVAALVPLGGFVNRPWLVRQTCIRARHFRRMRGQDGYPSTGS